MTASLNAKRRAQNICRIPDAPQNPIQLRILLLKSLKNIFEKDHFFSNSVTGIFKGCNHNSRTTLMWYMPNFLTPIFVEYFSMAASTNKKSILIRTRSLQKQKEMLRKQQKRKIGKTILSIKLFFLLFTSSKCCCN